MDAKDSRFAVRMSGNLKAGPQTAALLPGTHSLVDQPPFRRDASTGTGLQKSSTSTVFYFPCLVSFT